MRRLKTWHQLSSPWFNGNSHANHKSKVNSFVTAKTVSVVRNWSPASVLAVTMQPALAVTDRVSPFHVQMVLCATLPPAKATRFASVPEIIFLSSCFCRRDNAGNGS